MKKKWSQSLNSTGLKVSSQTTRILIELDSWGARRKSMQSFSVFITPCPEVSKPFSLLPWQLFTLYISYCHLCFFCLSISMRQSSDGIHHETLTIRLWELMNLEWYVKVITRPWLWKLNVDREKREIQMQSEKGIYFHSYSKSFSLCAQTIIWQVQARTENKFQWGWDVV